MTPADKPTTPAEQIAQIQSLVDAGLIGAEGLAALFGCSVERAQEIIDANERRRELLHEEEELRQRRMREFLLLGIP
jgi:hypothetical protein